MAQAATDFGIVEYKASWLEQQLEECLLAEKGIYLPPAKGIDLERFPIEFDLSRYALGAHYPYHAIIYTKTIRPYYPRQEPATEGGKLLCQRELAEYLSDTDNLYSEAVRFVLEDGLVTLAHEHHHAEECRDTEFTVTWGGGGLSMCSPVTRQEETFYTGPGSVQGKQDAIHAMNTLLAEVVHL